MHFMFTHERNIGNKNHLYWARPIDFNGTITCVHFTCQDVTSTCFIMWRIFKKSMRKHTFHVHIYIYGAFMMCILVQNTRILHKKLCVNIALMHLRRCGLLRAVGPEDPGLTLYPQAFPTDTLYTLQLYANRYFTLYFSIEH